MARPPVARWAWPRPRRLPSTPAFWVAAGSPASADQVCQVGWGLPHRRVLTDADVLLGAAINVGLLGRHWLPSVALTRERRPVSGPGQGTRGAGSQANVPPVTLLTVGARVCGRVNEQCDKWYGWSGTGERWARSGLGRRSLRRSTASGRTPGYPSIASGSGFLARPGSPCAPGCASSCPGGSRGRPSCRWRSRCRRRSSSGSRSRH